MPLLTTLRVRAIMRAHGGNPRYTNKTTGYIGNIRRVKAYYHDSEEARGMLRALKRACGKENVTLTKGSEYYGAPGIVVRCVLA